MAIITISRGSYSRGKEIAEKVAARLGYECFGRELLLETSQFYNVPEMKLVRAIHDAPSILDQFDHEKEKYVAYIQAAFLGAVQYGDVVYHGLAGHFFLRGISHVLKVRIISDWDDRIHCEMEREQVSREEAAEVLEKDDEERRQWSRSLYGIDTWDPQLYDLVIHVRKINTDLATDIICNVAQSEQFKPTAESKQRLEDLLLSARIKEALVGRDPEVEVTARAGEVSVNIATTVSKQATFVREVEEVVRAFPEVTEVRVTAEPIAHYG